MPLELLFLGTSTSAGVPMIGCHCEVCRSTDPRDKRTRPSVIISYPDASGPHAAANTAPPQRRLLIDTSPEMRIQMISNSIDRIDAVLYTHAHADHIFGLDDLRRFNTLLNAPIDMYVDAPTRQSFLGMFRYIFEAQNNLNQSWVPQLTLHSLDAGQPFDLFGARWLPLRLMHGRQPVLGFRVDLASSGGVKATATSGGGSLAYCTDVSTIPPETLSHLQGLDILVLDGLRYRPHPTHLSIDQALEVIDRLKPGRTYLTHIAHDILYADLEPRLPPGVHLSYDGLRVNCSDPVENPARKVAEIQTARKI